MREASAVPKTRNQFRSYCSSMHERTCACASRGSISSVDKESRWQVVHKRWRPDLGKESDAHDSSSPFSGKIALIMPRKILSDAGVGPCFRLFHDIVPQDVVSNRRVPLLVYAAWRS